ncbi:MAG: flagellar hook-associated protein 3 [Alphaproteobacteria bacterium TMED87]|nr:MAG: flagellar hook-associated protein 3 [Alphaproteobacteria bacterium TMED87]
MKISNSFLFDQATKNIQTAQSDVAKSREKIATGKSLVRPSDDTSKLRSIEILKSQQRKIESYDKSINFLTDRYKLEDSVLSSASDILIRLKSLAIQAANDTMATADRDIIAVEVKNLRDELVSLGNTRDVEGNFIFSGSKTETQPFVVDVMTGNVSYAGDNRRLFAAVSESRTIQSNTDGTEIFQPVERASRTYELTGFDSEGTHNFRVGESVIEFDVSAPLDQNQIKSAISSSLEASQFSSKVVVKSTDTITPGTVTNYDGVLTVSDGITTVTKDYAGTSPADLDAVLADIRAHASYGDLLFTVDKAANGTQLEYNWKADETNYQVETVTVGTLGSYTALSISDGTTTITPTVPGGGAGYASVDAAVTAIKAATNYANLGFTVAKAYNGTDIEFIWKTTGDQTATATYAATGVTNEAIATSTNKSPAASRATYTAIDGGATLGAITTSTNGVNSLGYYTENTNTANLINLTQVNITTMVQAGDSISIIDAALDKVAQMRSDLGAIENRLAYTVSNLMNIAEKTADARSRLDDADYALESARLAKAQVIQQAGTQMLAQANQLTQLVLDLLR